MRLDAPSLGLRLPHLPLRTLGLFAPRLSKLHFSVWLRRLPQQFLHRPQRIFVYLGLVSHGQESKAGETSTTMGYTTTIAVGGQR